MADALCRNRPGAVALGAGPAFVAALILGSAGDAALTRRAAGAGSARRTGRRCASPLLQAALSAAGFGGARDPGRPARWPGGAFAGRGALITLLGAPFLLPVVVAVLGLLAVFGRGGLVNAALAALGLPRLSIYGLHGVVLAHVFFNLPLATRMLLHGWQAIPAERFRLARSLGFGPREVFRHLEAPMLRARAARRPDCWSS